MKIAIFTDTFYPKIDGIVTSILNFSEKLVENKHKITVFSPSYKQFKELKMKGVSVHRFFSFSLASYKEVKIVLPNIKKIFSILRESKPDIIHIHTPGAMGYMGTLCAKILKIPCIGTYHTLVSEQLMYISLKKLLSIDKLINKIFESKLVGFLRKKSIKNDMLNFDRLGKQHRVGQKLVWNLSCKIYNRCDLVVVPSKSIKKLLKQKGIKKRIVVISNGINLNLFREKKTYPKKISSLIHVGRISFEKNVDRTIRAFSRVVKTFPKIEYVIVGDGPALISLKNMASRMGLEHKIKFLGYIPYKKLTKYYRKAGFFVTASTMETQGLVILEAMASGLPVLGVDAFAIPDIVKDDYNGFVVGPRDIGGMAKIMEKMIDNPQLVEKLGRNATIYAKRHNLDNTSKLLEKTYSRLVKDYNIS